MLVVEEVVPLKEHEQEVHSLLQVEFLVFIEFEHLLGNLDQDRVLGTPRPKDDLGVFCDDAGFANFLIVLHQVGKLQFELVEVEGLPVVDVHPAVA